MGWKAVLTRPVMSWALYDLANTIFSMNIVSFYLSLWVVNVMGGTDATWGFAVSLTMVMVFLSAPILGALSDQAGRRLPFLMVCTIVCVGFTAALGTGGLMITLVFFVIANYFFQASLIFYDATLSVVSTHRRGASSEASGWASGTWARSSGCSPGYCFWTGSGMWVSSADRAPLPVLRRSIFLFVRESSVRGTFDSTPAQSDARCVR